MPDLGHILDEARALSENAFGPGLEFFLPGMFMLDGKTGKYPAVSITGGECRLACEHCRGLLLKSMVPALTPEELVCRAHELKSRGRLGMLVSGGSDENGRLPWGRYTTALEQIVRETGMFVTVHAGYLNLETALGLKNAGVSQALVDVMGDDDTARRVYHLERGTAPVWETMDALTSVGLEIVPHVVLGLHFGRIKGEYNAVERLADYQPVRLVTVVLSPLKNTPMHGLTPPPVDEAARFLAEARNILPRARHHLGCARPRGHYRQALDQLAVRAGINALALPSLQAYDEAERLGRSVSFHKTCCSLAGGWLKQVYSYQ